MYLYMATFRMEYYTTAYSTVNSLLSDQEKVFVKEL